jgi:putative transcriptional regulator
LEQEMRRHGWFVTPGDESLLYDRSVDERWAAAFAGAGVDPRLLTAEFGTA